MKIRIKYFEGATKLKKISKGINIPEGAYIIKNFNISQNGL